MYEGDVGDFVSELHKLMQSWGWEEWQIHRDLPRVLAVLEGVGILRKADDTYFPTPLVASNEAWHRAWELLEREGVGERAGS